MSKSMRAILPLLRARVVEHGSGYFKLTFGAEYGSPTSIRITANTDMLDLHTGDLLTMYTEVLLAKPKEPTQ